MRTIYTALFIFLAGFIVSGCGGSDNVTEDLPDWYVTPPETNNEYMYAVGEATSSRRSVAREQAMQQGRANIAQEIESVVSTMEKNFMEEITSGDESNYREVFTSVNKTVAQQKLTGVERTEMIIKRTEDGRRYRCMLLVRMPIGEAGNAIDQALKNTLSRDEELYTEFKKKKAFDQLNEELEKMKEGEGTPQSEGGGGN